MDIEPEQTEAEREQMKKFETFRKTATTILVKWTWLLVLVFAVVAAAAAVGIERRASRSIGRYSAITKLLFSPRPAANIQPMGDRQLLGVLDRASIKRSVAQRMSLSVAEARRLPGDLKIVQERKPTNMFTLTATASSYERAIEKVNAYAAVLVEEYVAYRTRDLTQWGETLERRKAGLLERVAAFDAEETLAKTKTGAVSPVETLTLLNGLVSDQRRNLSRLGVDLASAKAKNVTVGKLTLDHVKAYDDALKAAGIESKALSPKLLPDYTRKVNE